jgi:hypothetical protein
MESIKEQAYLGLNPHCSYLYADISIVLPPWSLQRRWATLDGIKIETKNCCHVWKGHLQNIL